MIPIFPHDLTPYLSAALTGVNVGGWLLIEEWMFSDGIFDKVAEWSNEPQGVILPPALPNGFGEYWYSEGGRALWT
jgi:hypothetical protein